MGLVSSSWPSWWTTRESARAPLLGLPEYTPIAHARQNRPQPVGGLAIQALSKVRATVVRSMILNVVIR
jgi:hypothetical protein